MDKIAYRPKSVRQFLALLLVFAGLVTWRLTRARADGVVWEALLAEAAVVAFFLALPKLFFPVYRAILAASRFVGSVLFVVISAVVFYLVLTPLALVMRATGKKFLVLNKDASAATYFSDVPDGDDITRQY